MRRHRRPFWRRQLGSRPLAVVLVVYALLVVSYSLATPMGEAPDETTHLEYVLYLLREHRLPVIPPPPEIGMQQAKHPPLYYLGGATLTFWADFTTLGFMPNPHFSYNLEKAPVATAFVHLDHEQFPYNRSQGFLAARIMRLVSLLCGLTTVWATYRLARLLWPQQEYLAWGSAAAIAFVPGFLFASGVFNNDMGANAFSSLAFLAALRVVLGHVRRRDLALLGLVVGLGLITKLTTITSVALAALAVLMSATRRREWRLPVRAALEVGLPIVLVAGWWFGRNMWLYGLNDPLALERWSTAVTDLARQVPLSTELKAYLWVQLTTFWGRFGWATVSLPTAVYQGLLALMALSALGLLFLLARAHQLTADQRWGLSLIAAAVLLAYLSVFRLAFKFNLVVAHGRLLYIALPGLGVLFVTGLAQLVPPRARPWLVLLLDAGLAILSVVALFGYLMPAFARPKPLTPSQIEAIQHRVDVDYDDRFRLYGYDLAAERITAGQPLTVTLYWGALPASWDPFPPPVEGHVVFLHALDATGEVVGRVDVLPFRGIYTTTGWTPGRVYREQYVVPISADAVPGRATLLVGLYESEPPRARLAVTHIGGRQVGGSGAVPTEGNRPAPDDAFRIAPLVIRPAVPPRVSIPEAGRRADTFTVVGPLPAGAGQESGPRQGGEFGLSDQGSSPSPGVIRLVGYEYQVDASRQLSLTLYWRAEVVPERDYTVFVHLVGSDGELVATGDSPPQSGRYPTSLWQAGEIVVDRHVLSLPGEENTPPGEDRRPPLYRLLVGWYDPATNRRLAATDARGQPWANDAADLGAVSLP